MITSSAPDINARLDAIEAHQTRIERKLDRLVAMFAPDGLSADFRAVMDGCYAEDAGWEEVRRRMRERERRIREQKQQRGGTR